MEKHLETQIEDNPTQKLEVLSKTLDSGVVVPQTPYPVQPEIRPLVQTPRPKGTRTRPISKRDAARIAALQERCRQLCLSLFFRSQPPVHSLGLTSSVSGEGKSFLATVMASTLARDSSDPVV